MNIKTLILSTLLTFSFISLNAQYVTYDIGLFKTHYYIDGVKSNTIDIEHMMIHNQASADNWKRYKKQLTISSIFSGVGTAGLVTGLVSDNTDVSLAGYTVGLLSSVASLVTISKAKSSHKLAIDNYNVVNKTTSYIIKPSSEGIGLSLHF